MGVKVIIEKGIWVKDMEHMKVIIVKVIIEKVIIEKVKDMGRIEGHHQGKHKGRGVHGDHKGKHRMDGASEIPPQRMTREDLMAMRMIQTIGARS